jgi:pyruvate ferredoxin oxidoreductase alpha subunit
LRDEGIKAGMTSLRLWRPFPRDDIVRELGGAKVVSVVDRALSTGGGGGPIANELRAAFYHESERPDIVSFVAGLSGRDIMIDQFVDMVKRSLKYAEKGEMPYYEVYGVRE